ncbi:MAG: alanine--tRNA ligase, partial [Defluviitaleaceae bacterium]|nr:alanine--tRNA ligase [Defluviitaleaceae bacterium]
MKYLTVNQIRDKFLDFFIAKGHTFLPSFPLVPEDDNSLLLIGAGMAPMKKFFTGQAHPPSSRVVTCQKCVRTVDIDDVGKDARHASFFEMLGNFSFGDYFKAEVIPWAWEFITEIMEIPIEKLYVSVYHEDDEAYNIWQNVVGLPPERIVRLGKEDNFWELGVGPCGPCSEIHYDRGAENGCGKPNCAVGCDCDRYLEFWNLVFIQYEKLEDGSYTPLATTGIDTGMGLERISLIMQDAATIFEIDNIKSIRDQVLTLAGIGPKFTSAQIVSANIIADHVRSVAFIASDGVQPSNEGRGYVLRRMLRRAIRHGQTLGLKGAFVTKIARLSIKTYANAYPNLAEKADHILLQLSQEETRFLETLDTGMNLLQKHIAELKKHDKTTLPGSDAFKLYDTYGFPPDLTREILEESGLAMDMEGFTAEMENQKSRARAARSTSTYMGADETVYNKLPPGLPTEFCGYESHTCEAKVLAILCDGEPVNSASANESGTPIAIILNKTPFYAASGGQKADTGVIVTAGTDATEIETAKMQIVVEDCQRVIGNNTAHLGLLKSGTVTVGQTVTATIAMVRRVFTMRNHTATHLLQKALREVLGGHVEQSGSDVGPDRLRFDFTHTAPLTPDERSQVEALVNERILAGLPVTITETTPDEARKKGALALFGEKYGETVRMVDIGGYSIELCGGTHVETTHAIGPFKLISESGIAAGVRRIEATTGQNALAIYRDAASALAQVAEICKVNQSDLPERLQALLAENKQLKKDAARKTAEAAKEQQANIAADLIKDAETHNNFKLISARLDNYDIEALRQLCDQLRAEITSGCLLLCGVNAETGAAQFLASATDDAVKSGVHAGNLVKEAAALCGGGGGGRPNHAQAGGKDASKADEAIAAGLATMKNMLK